MEADMLALALLIAFIGGTLVGGSLGLLANALWLTELERARLFRAAGYVDQQEVQHVGAQ